MACGCTAVACGRVTYAPAAFHCALSDAFHPTKRAEQEELDRVMITIRLINDSAGKELSMANESCLEGSLARPAFSSFLFL
jgi:hypothetical protein